MIDDSIPWKDELIRVADRLRKKKSQQRWTERSGFLVERDIMVSAYALRKLKEAHKLSDVSDVREVPVTKYMITGSLPDLLSRHEIWESYDLERGVQVVLNLTGLCNQIIHSWVWTISADKETGLFNGIFVSSDQARKKCLYFISIEVLIELFDDIGREDVYSKTMEVGEDGQRQFVEKLAR